jgi:type I restriction enzyme S subunit
MPIKNNQGADNIPKLRFPEFSGGWDKKKLGEVSEKINSGKTPLGGESVYTESGVLFIRSQNVNNDRLELDNITFISELINAGMKNSIVKSNDILLNITGASLGRSCVVADDFKTGNVNQHVCIIRLKSDYNPRFVQPILSSEKGQKIFNSLQTGSGREGLNFESIKSIELTLPSLPEQQKIASFLSAVDEKLQALKKKKSLLEQYKKGVMQKIFSLNHDSLDYHDDHDFEEEQKEKKSSLPSQSQKARLRHLRFKDDDGNAFAEWEVKNGGEIFESISNKNHSSDLPILAISQEHGAVPREMINYQISVTERSVESYKVVDEGDFIISLRSFQGGIEYSKYKGICSPAYVILRNTAPINKEFFKYYFKTDYYIQRLCEKLEGIRDGKMISYKYFSEIELPYPSLPEQTKISNFLSAIDEKIQLVQGQVEKMEAWKKGLLQKMFV